MILVAEVADWYLDLVDRDPQSAGLIEAAIDLLVDEGPRLGRPLVDNIKGSSVHHLKELRPGSGGNSEIRILFAFDPVRNAVLLAAGDKSSRWRNWYCHNIP